MGSNPIKLNAPTPQQLALITVVTKKVMELGASVELVLPVTEGPRLIYFGLRPSSATKVSALEGLASDLAVALGVRRRPCKADAGTGGCGHFHPTEGTTTREVVGLVR